MPKNKNYTIAIIVGVLLIGLLSLYVSNNDENKDVDTPVSSETSSSTTNGVTAPKPATQGGSPSTNLTTGKVPGFYSYANATHNFSIQYPSYIQPLTSFATFHEIGNNWRLYAGQANQGKPVVSFSIHNIDQGTYFTGKQTYPLYFSAEVRVGVSPNVKECYTPDAGNTNQKITNVTINGVAFKKFSTSVGGMQKYVQAESYRTIRNNSCYVIEQIRTGSSYRDEKMTTAKTEKELINYYNLGENIVKTFKFTK